MELLEDNTVETLRGGSHNNTMMSLPNIQSTQIHLSIHCSHTIKHELVTQFRTGITARNPEM